MNKTERIKALIANLNQAGVEYYQNNNEMMSNLEYDRLYDELRKLEQETGIVFGNSPTQKVGAEILSELPKRTHESRMLSLDKTKSVDDLRAWLSLQTGLLSWKLDGLTIVLTYQNGDLSMAVTRGNGSIGEEITANAKVFANIPVQIPFTGELILRGEAVILYSEFEQINAKIEDMEAKYKNPRNLCSGTVRQLNTAITKERNVRFYAFGLVRAEGMEFQFHHEEMDWLRDLGFEIVEFSSVTEENLEESIHEFQKKIERFDIPSDGLVLLLDDIAHGESLGTTSKFPRNAMAFKWNDEQKQTKLLAMEWSPSRTGLINPVAIFEPVDLEGTTVSRASVHNVSIVESLELGLGDELLVYKANMIIPQIAGNLTKSNTIKPPKHCPVCESPTYMKNESGIKTLYCTNPDCPVKQLKSFGLMVSRDALNIDGLSEMTLEKFLQKGFLHQRSDVFELKQYKDEIITMEGFGQKSYDKLIAAIEAARYTTLPRLIYALGIAGIGQANAKMLAKHFHFDFDAFAAANALELQSVEGIGEVLATSIVDFFAMEKNKEEVQSLLSKLQLEKPAGRASRSLSGQARQQEPDSDGNVSGGEFSGVMSDTANREEILQGKTFVITGSLVHFQNRSELEERIESLGGKTSSSVSKKTSYLINNDTTSTSGKNKKAKELGIAILSEADFLKMIEETM